MAAVSLHQRLFAHCSTKKAAEQRGQSSPAFYRYFFHISPFYCTYIVMRSIQPFYHTAMGVVWIVPVVVNPHKQNLSGAAFQCLDVTPDLTVAKPKSSLCFISSCRESGSLARQRCGYRGTSPSGNQSTPCLIPLNTPLWRGSRFCLTA